MRLRSSGWWTESASLNNRLSKQLMSEEDKKLVEFVEDDTYDYIIVLGRLKDGLNIKDKSKVIFFSQEPLWSPNETRNPSEFAHHSVIADKRVYENPDDLEETLLPMFYAGHNETHSSVEYDWSYNLRYQDNSNKTKNISYIVRKDYCSHWNSYVNKDVCKLLYQNRTDLATKISLELPSITIGGINWQNNDANILGNIWNKRVALNEYRFSICVENTIQKNYVSEKFWDAVLIDTVPIYIGSNNISEYVPSDSFINLTPYADDLDILVKKISQIDENAFDLYQKYKPKIKVLKEIFFTDKRFNLWLKIKDIIGL